MRRYRIEIRGRTFEIDVDEAGADRFEVVVDGETYDVLLDSDEDLPEARITPHLDSGQSPSADRTAPRAADATAAAPASEARKAAGAVPAARPAAAAAPGAICAPMPGAIVEINVRAGQRVKRGDVVAVLEAMKMNNAIRSPRDGSVAEVLVSEGQSVKHGEPLVRLEG